jgi:hypothetical protein
LRPRAKRRRGGGSPPTRRARLSHSCPYRDRLQRMRHPAPRRSQRLPRRSRRRQRLR